MKSKVVNKKNLILIFSFIILIVVYLSSANFQKKQTQDTFSINKTIKMDSGSHYIHGLIFAQESIYAITRTSPAKIIKINPKSMDIVKSLSFPSDGIHNYGEDIIYVSSKDRLYIIFNSKPSRDFINSNSGIFYTMT